MISPSESSAEHLVSRDGPVKLWRSELSGGKDVSRLEFCLVERSRNESTVDAEMGPGSSERELPLKEEVAALNLQLQSQTQQIATQLEEARRLARAEARDEWEEELEERVAKERAVVLRTCEEFERERARYFAGVEAEVVKLSLAIAARVLHRESTLDQLLLAAAVRVALEKVAEDSTTVLRVPTSEVEMWRKVFVSTTDSAMQLMGDERLEAGECLLETNVGKVELGVVAQLVEIERGFFDLLQQRPA